MGIFGNPSDDKSKQGYVAAANKPTSAQKPREALKAADGSNMQAVRNAAFEAERQQRAFGKKR